MWTKVYVHLVLLILSTLTIMDAQKNGPLPAERHNRLSQNIGNFSLELLYHTSKGQNANLILSPFTVWTAMAVIAEGASDRTLEQLIRFARIVRDDTRRRREFQALAQHLIVNTTTVELVNVNSIFVDQKHMLEKDFKDIVSQVYRTEVKTVTFKESQKTANIINQYISKVTHGRIPSLVDASSLAETEMILTNALYFKAQWAAPFNVTSTEPAPFYDSAGKKIGNVKMMYNRFTYPFANIRQLQARVLELPYGKENRLSMLVMLPDPNVSLEAMFHNFIHVPLDKLFRDLKASQIEYGEDEVDCFLPRFKIESSIVLNNALRTMGISDLFDQYRARLPGFARTSVYVNRVIHKAEIEVTEEGTTASAATAAEFANRIGIVRFEANRPFAYMIIEKMTNSIVFGGIYQEPSLF